MLASGSIVELMIAFALTIFVIGRLWSPKSKLVDYEIFAANSSGIELIRLKKRLIKIDMTES